MDIFGILDPDPHENLCGSETLLSGDSYDFNYLDCALHGRGGGELPGLFPSERNQRYAGQLNRRLNLR